jgi:hypothetical protein
MKHKLKELLVAKSHRKRQEMKGFLHCNRSGSFLFTEILPRMDTGFYNAKAQRRRGAEAQRVVSFFASWRLGDFAL